MKKFTLFSALGLLLVVSATIAMASTLYSPWLVESMRKTDPVSGSWDTQIFIYNTDTVAHTVTYTLRKYNATSTTTTLTALVPAKDVIILSWEALANTGSWFTSTVKRKFGTLEIADPNDYYLGFVFRYRTYDYGVNYTDTYIAK